MSWTVRLVGADEDPELGVFVIGVAEQKDGEGQNLVFQINLESSETEDPDDYTYCLTNEAGAVTYGGVLNWTINDQHFTVTLTPEAAGILMMDVETTFPLEVPPEQVELLRQGLSRVFSSE